MGLFGDNKQEQLDSSAQRLYNAMTALSLHLDSAGGSLDQNGRIKASQAEDAIVEFCQICQRYQGTHNFVNWLGKRTMINGVLMTVTGFATEVEQATGYIFSRLR